MNSSGAGRRFGVLAADLTPARMEFARELRQRLAQAEISLRRLAVRVHMDAGTVSRYASGARLPSTHGLQELCQALDLDEPARLRLFDLLNRALGEVARSVDQSEDLLRASDEEAQLARLAQELDRANVGRYLLELLKTLRAESGLGVRQIADRLSAAGVPAGKSSVDRAIRDPQASLQLSLHIAEVLIEEVPLPRRGPLRDGLFRVLLNPASKGPHLELVALYKTKLLQEISLEERPTTREQALTNVHLIASLRAQLLKEVDLAEAGSLSVAEQRARLERVLGHIISREGPLLSTVERSSLIRTVVDDVLSLPQEKGSLSVAEQRARLERVLGHIISREGPLLSTVERSLLIRTVVDDVLGVAASPEGSRVT